jgi:hypothetical protein
MLIAKRDRLNWFVGDRDFVNIIKSLVVGCVVARRNAPDETNAIALLLALSQVVLKEL